MRSGFRPHDRDRTTESIEGSLLCFGLFREGSLLQHTNRLCGCPVNRWSTKRPPNGTKLDWWPTGGIPRPLDKSRSIPRTFNTRSRNENKRVHRRRWECRIAKRTTGKMFGCKRRTHMQMRCMKKKNNTRRQRTEPEK